MTAPNPDDVTTRLREEDLRAMIDGCKGVTPGPWELEASKNYEDGHGRYEGYEIVAPNQGDTFNVVTDCSNATVAVIHDEDGRRWDKQGEANMAHFARLDPQTVSAMASELLSLRRQLADRDAGIDMAMGCLDPHSENRDEAIAWWRLVDTKAGHRPRSALGEPQ